MATKPKFTEEVKITQEICEELLELMGVNASIETSFDAENEAVNVNIQSETERGLLIGHRGENLLALQTVMGIMLKNKLDRWVRVIVNIGDWREKQEDQLQKLAISTAERVKQTGEPQPLYNLSAAERRIVHMELSKDEEVETESTGEGEDRYLIVKPKQ